MSLLALFMLKSNKSCIPGPGTKINKSLFNNILGIFVGKKKYILLKYKISKDIRYLSIVLIKKNYDPPFFTDQMKVVTEIKYITFLLLAV